MNSSLNLSEDSSLKDLRSKASQVMNELQKKNPQYFMNGSKNIWILKPTSKKPNFFFNFKIFFKVCQEGVELSALTI